jgi:long-chain acyl-CoA synthetase
MSLSYDEIRALLTAPGQMFEIEELDIDGIRMRNWKNTPASMAAIVEQSRNYGDREFIVYKGERLSYSEHYARVATLAKRLACDLGVEKGDRVAIAMRNYPEWCIAFWAAASAGAVVVPLNAWWTAEELRYGIEDSGSKLIFVDGERLERLASVRARCACLQQVVAVRCRDVPADAIDFGDLVAGASPDSVLPAIAFDPEDLATLFYTSGSTGFPKGTMGTQRNFCSAAITVPYNGVRSMLRMGRSPEELAELQATMVPAALLTVPLFHVTGCHGIMLGMFVGGGKLVVMHKWDPAEALDLIEQERISLFGAVPTMAWQLVESPGIGKRDLSSLVNIGYGGAPAAPELLRRIKAVLPEALPSNGWGITEASSAITMISGQDYEARPESVGHAFPIIELKVVNEGGEEVPRGGLGELWIKGPNVVKGYWNKPEATAKSFTQGWFHTGDVGKIDEEGFVYVVDRLKDMIIRGGENVYCAEVEAALLEHADVNAACVFGVPHRVLGEEVGCVVEVAPDRSIDEQELRQHLASRVAKFKIPTRVWFRHEPLPLGATGKIQKKELREFYIAQLDN